MSATIYSLNGGLLDRTNKCNNNGYSNSQIIGNTTNVKNGQINTFESYVLNLVCISYCFL